MSDTIYTGAWEAFLRNKRELAGQRARAGIKQLAARSGDVGLTTSGSSAALRTASEVELAERLVTEADLSYIAGACSNNDAALLERAVSLYHEHLALQPSNANARRMLGEALLRLRRYGDACIAFEAINRARLDAHAHRHEQWQSVIMHRSTAAADADAVAEGADDDSASVPEEQLVAETCELELAPFRLRHDADLIEHLFHEQKQDGGRQAGQTAIGEWQPCADALRRVSQVLERRLASTDSVTAVGSPTKDEASEGIVGNDDSVSRRLGRIRVGSAALSPALRRTLLAGGRYDALGLLGCGWDRQVYPVLPGNGAGALDTDPGLAPLRARTEPGGGWAEIEREYRQNSRVVIDNLLSDGALAELQRYARSSTSFRTMRGGFLGAFPADGTTHPIILALARALEAAMPSVFQQHPLGLWWLFKYPPLMNADSDSGGGSATCSSASAAGAQAHDAASAPPPAENGETTPTSARGIGIHADPAAVNVNIWLTDDSAHLRGGGLHIFHHVPPLEAGVAEVNREFKDEAEETAFRAELESTAPVTYVPYACNRATLFVSDQYHVSEPFEFRSGYANHRVNLTLLFGDRIQQKVQMAAHAGDEGGGGKGGGAADSTAGSNTGVGSGDEDAIAKAARATAEAEALFSDSDSDSSAEG